MNEFRDSLRAAAVSAKITVEFDNPGQMFAVCGLSSQDSGLQVFATSDVEFEFKCRKGEMRDDEDVRMNEEDKEPGPTESRIQVTGAIVGLDFDTREVKLRFDTEDGFRLWISEPKKAHTLLRMGP